MRILGLLMLMLMVTATSAQVTTAFTYQGKLEQAGTPTSGNFDFEVELYDSATGGISFAGPLPIDDVAVDSGLFRMSIDFGMNVFGQQDLWLEVRVREGSETGAYTPLAPRQKITPAPMALHALNVEAGVIGSAQLAADSVTSVQIADGSVGAAHVDSSQVQLRVDDSCAVGSAIRQINADGTVACSTPPAAGLSYGWFSDVVVDTGNVGAFSSIIIGIDALPIISYYDANDGDLEIFHCDNPACTSGTQTTLDSSGVVGKYTSITIGRSGYPLISYYDDSNGDLKLAQCSNIACTSSTTHTLDDAGNVGQYTSITTNEDGYAFISYYDVTNGDLKAIGCINLSCSSNTIWTVDSAGDVGRYSSVTRNSNDYGYISYYDATDGDLMVARCVNMACDSPAINRVDGNGTTGGDPDDVGHHSSITTGVDGFPLIAYAKIPQPSSGSQMRVAHCTTSTCSTADTDTMISASTLSWQGISITLGRDGLGLITAGFDTTSRIYAFHCHDTACSEQDISDSVVTSGAVDSAITVGADGLPVLSYSTDTDDALRVVHCSDWSCQAYLRRR